MKNRIDDGINIFFALQGSGKTYVCTHKGGYELLNPNRKRKVISNYPIIVTIPLTTKQKIINAILNLYKKDSKSIKLFGKTITLTKQIEKKLSSYKWLDEYTDNTQYHIRDAIIIIDEGHRRYSGAYAWLLTPSDRDFFSTLRHNNIVALFMTQRFNDIHPFIKDRAAYFHEVSKKKWFWKKTPSSFYIDTYLSIKDYNNKDAHKRIKRARPTRYRREKIPFSNIIGNAYNTHCYKHNGEEPQYISWLDELNNTIPTIIEKPIIVDTISNEVIKDVVGALMKLHKWKRREATLEVNKLILENDISDVNTVEKLLRLALAKRSYALEEKEKEKQKQEGNIEEEEL